jgi:hypothetical protein
MVTVLSLHFEQDMTAESLVAAGLDLDGSNLVAPFSWAKAVEVEPAISVMAKAMLPAVRIFVSEPIVFIWTFFVFGNHHGCRLTGLTPRRRKTLKICREDFSRDLRSRGVNRLRTIMRLETKL